MNVIEHVPDPLNYLWKINDMLVEGGKLLLGTPNGLIAKKNKCIIKNHNWHHIMEYFPVELISLLNNTGFKLDSFYSNKNIAVNSYDIPSGKKMIIKILYKIGLFEIARKIIKKVSKQAQSIKNSTAD